MCQGNDNRLPRIGTLEFLAHRLKSLVVIQDIIIMINILPIVSKQYISKHIITFDARVWFEICLGGVLCD